MHTIVLETIPLSSLNSGPGSSILLHSLDPVCP